MDAGWVGYLGASGPLPTTTTTIESIRSVTSTMPEVLYSPANTPIDYDGLMSSMMGGARRDNTLTINSEFFALDPPYQPAVAGPVLSEASIASIASSPSSFVDSPVSSEHDLSSISSPFECQHNHYHVDDAHQHPQPAAATDFEQMIMTASASPTTSACSAPTLSASPPALASFESPPLAFAPASNPKLVGAFPASPMPPPAAATAVNSSVQPKLAQDPNAEFDSACRSLKEMAASGTSASAMMLFLTMSRQTLNRDIPAEVVLQGLIECEKRKSATPNSPAPSSSTSSFGAQRRPRSSLREAASPYAIPAGPRMYQCDQCPLVFDRAYNLKEHLKTHDPHCNKRFRCPLSECSHASHRRADMHRHIKNVHLKREGLTLTQRNVVVAAYPALQEDMFPDNHQGLPYDLWDVPVKSE